MSSARANGHARMRQVADRAGVSMSSVSRVLSEHPDVSDAMRERVLEAVAAIGYEPDLLAQSLRRGATLTIGFVVGDISNPLIGKIALGAESALRSAGYSMLLTNSENDPAQDARHILLFQQRRVDGLLLSLADESHRATLVALERAAVPFVGIDRDIPSSLGGGAVLCDHRRGMTDAGRHLIELGHRRLAFIGGSQKVRPTRERARALRDVARSLGAEVVPHFGSYTADHGMDATTELLAMPQRPTAIIVGGNQILPGVLKALRTHRLRIPRDVSVVSCDDGGLIEFTNPAIATVSRSAVDMGRVAAELLLRQLGGGPPERQKVPATFTAAESCGPPAAVVRARRS